MQVAQRRRSAQQNCSVRHIRGGFSDDSDDEMSIAARNYADDDEVGAFATVAASATDQPEPDVSSNGSLSLNTRVEYAALPQNRAQDIFGLVTVQAAAASAAAEARAAADRPPVDVICVLDVSGSMQGTKISLVQDAVRFVVDELRAEDRLSLVRFNHSSERVLRLRRMDALGKDEAHRQAFALCAGGGTSISSGLEAGLAVAEQRRQRNPVTAILLLTDGQDGGSRGRLPSLIERARVAGCSLYAFGFGADHDAGLLSSLAEQAQTPFSYIEDVDTIRSTFAGAVGGLVSVTAQRIELTLECHYALKKVHTPFQVQRISDKHVKVQIPDMLAGERRDVLVELSVSEGVATEESLLEASARYWDLGHERLVQIASLQMLMTRLSPDKAQPEAEMEPDVEVSAQRCRVEATEALSIAREHGEAGRFQDAQGVLAAGRQKLRASPKTAFSDAMELELEAAVSRLQDSEAWESGGRAELSDMYQMNRMQRAMHTNQKSKCAVRRTSMDLYTNSVQKSWVNRSCK